MELQEPEFELSGLKSGLKIVRTLAQARKPFFKIKFALFRSEQQLIHFASLTQSLNVKTSILIG